MAKYKSQYTGAQIDAAVGFGYNPDNAPTENSKKGVKSGGVWSAIQNAIQSITALIPTALSQLGDDATHRLTTDTEKSTWSGKQDALSFVSTPSSSNKVLTQNEMGQYKRETKTESTATLTLAANTLYDWSTTALTSAVFTLGTPTTTGSNEWVACFKAGSNFALTVTPPAGYTLKWKDGTPTFTNGNYYELSFLQHTSYIFGIVAEVEV